MMITTVDVRTARNGEARRAAKIAMLRQQMVQQIQRTDASALRIEQALTSFVEAIALGNRLSTHH